MPVIISAFAARTDGLAARPTFPIATHGPFGALLCDTRFLTLRVMRSIHHLLFISLALFSSACDVTITTSTPLTPQFDRSVFDYVTRCDQGPIQVAVDGDRGTRVRVDGRTVAAGENTQVSLQPGEAFTMQILPAIHTSYSVRCLPTDFPQVSIERPGVPQAEWYVATPFKAKSIVVPDETLQYVVVFDNMGVPVWWMKAVGATRPTDAKLLPNGNIAWLRSGTAPDGQVGGAEEHRLDGTLVRFLNTVDGPADTHELQLLPNGNYAMGRYVQRDGVNLVGCGGPESATIIDNDFQELTPDGTLVWLWNALEHIPIEETLWKDVCTPDLATHDIYHFNSIEADGDSFVISFRHLKAIYKISRSTGAIVWKLGGTSRPESLTVGSDAFPDEGGNLFGGQHYARRMPDGTWTVHDNRTGEPDAVPRAVRFKIDENARTATLVESVSDVDVPISGCCGSARKLNSGNWVMEWGARPAVTELTPEGALVFRINFTQDLYSYRVDAVEPGVLSRGALRAGMNAQHPRGTSEPAEP